jgi:hypothetical protein
MQSRISGGMDLGRPPPTLTYPSHPVVTCPYYPINGKGYWATVGCPTCPYTDQ